MHTFTLLAHGRVVDVKFATVVPLLEEENVLVRDIEVKISEVLDLLKPIPGINL